MRPRRTKTINRLLAVVTCGLLAFAGTATAKADVVDDYTAAHAVKVCQVLDEYPNVGGVEALVLVLMEKGLEPEGVGRVIAGSVIGWCPGHMDVLEAFVAKWDTGQKSMAA